MSAGKFTNAVYVGATPPKTTRYGVRVQPETLLLTIGGEPNSGSADAANQQAKAHVSGNHRTGGVSCSKVRFRWEPQTVAGAPDNYDPLETLTLPTLNANIRAAAAVKGATGSYLNKNIVVVGTTPEYIN